jgi:ATP-dependent Clp protease ATP-binding subunit ClpB
MFTPLDRKHLEGIVKIQLGYLFEKLKGQQIHLKLTDDAMQFIIERGYDPAMGARPVKRVIQKEVLNALSKAILSNMVKKEEPIVMDVFDGQVVFRAPIENEKLISL